MNGTMNGKQQLAIGQVEQAARTVLGGKNQIRTRLFGLSFLENLCNTTG